MKSLALIIGWTLLTAPLCAQGLPVDFDADAFENPAPGQAAEPIAAARIVDTAPLRRSVRYGEHTETADNHSPAQPVHVVEAPAGS